MSKHKPWCQILAYLDGRCTCKNLKHFMYWIARYFKRKEEMNELDKRVESFTQGTEFEQWRVIRLLNDELNDCQCETPLQHLRSKIRVSEDTPLGEE